MKRALPAALLVLLASAAAAADAPGGGLSVKSFGEGGGYKHPDAATGQYLEDVPRREAPSASPRAEPAPERAPAPRVSLWSGRVSPIERPPARAGAADSDPDTTRDLGRRDYESRVLGREDLSARPRVDGPPEAPGSEGAAPAVDEPRLFVSVELDPREAGSLRDAVAGLGASVGFSADARFQPLSGPSGVSMISGWLPASQLGLAVSQPGVKRLRVETSPRPSPAREITGEFLVGLRLEDASRAREAVDAGVRALTSTAGFRLTRVVGLETSPDGRAAAVIAGLLPLSRLSKAMGRPEVIKITPLSSSPAPLAAAPERPSRILGFARFMAEDGLWLLLLTLAAALPTLRRAVGRALSVFVPYR